VGEAMTPFTYALEYTQTRKMKIITTMHKLQPSVFGRRRYTPVKIQPVLHLEHLYYNARPDQFTEKGEIVLRMAELRN
jgi:hypothetical protein